jgi:DNA-binding NtrC family response regulator
MAADHWPGNVRELKNFLERSLILGYFPIEALAAAGGVVPEVETDSGEMLDQLSLAEVEKRHVLRVLDMVSGNKSEAARRLGVSRKTLERKCLEWSEPKTPGAPEA